MPRGKKKEVEQELKSNESTESTAQVTMADDSPMHKRDEAVSGLQVGKRPKFGKRVFGE